jgi:hypothetical protein
MPCSPRSSPRSSASSTPDFAARIRSGTRSNPPPARSMSGTASPPTSRSRRSSMASRPPRRHRGDQGRAPARHLRRLGHHRPHLARRRDQEGQPGRPFLVEQRRGLRGLQQLRLAPRQRPRHDPRHLRQRPHQEPHGPRQRRRRHPLLRDQRGNPRQPHGGNPRASQRLPSPVRSRPTAAAMCSIYDAAAAYQKGTPPSSSAARTTAWAPAATGPPRAPICSA